MNAKPEDTTSTEEWLRWHITRCDGLRAAIANRATLVISANALLLVSLGLFFDKGSELAVVSPEPWPFAVSAILAAAVLVLLSVCFGVFAALHPFRTSAKLFPNKIGSRLLFYPRETVASFKEKGAFAERYMSTKPKEMIAFGLEELWGGILQQFQRHQHLRQAIRFLLFAFGLEVLSVLVLLYMWAMKPVAAP